jgi:hypothetical protein
LRRVRPIRTFIEAFSARSRPLRRRELDSVDAYGDDTGFPPTVFDQLRYVRQLEECFAHGSCADYRPLGEAGLAVLAVEYGPVGNHCEEAAPLTSALSESGLDPGADRQTR